MSSSSLILQPPAKEVGYFSALPSSIRNPAFYEWTWRVHFFNTTIIMCASMQCIFSKFTVNLKFLHKLKLSWTKHVPTRTYRVNLTPEIFWHEDISRHNYIWCRRRRWYCNRRQRKWATSQPFQAQSAIRHFANEREEFIFSTLPS